MRPMTQFKVLGSHRICAHHGFFSGDTRSIEMEAAVCLQLEASCLQMFGGAFLAYNWSFLLTIEGLKLFAYN